MKEKLPIQTNGYINLDVLLAHKSLNGKCNIEDIKRIVANNNKQRFTLNNHNGVLEIRANQGHSLQVYNKHYTYHNYNIQCIIDSRQSAIKSSFKGK